MWANYPSLTDASKRWTEYENLYDFWKLKQDYKEFKPKQPAPVQPAQRGPEIALKNTIGPIKCSYCLENAKSKAQVCLHCGSYLCMACAYLRCATYKCEGAKPTEPQEPASQIDGLF